MVGDFGPITIDFGPIRDIKLMDGAFASKYVVKTKFT
jgi:hypothetical protein